MKKMNPVRGLLLALLILAASFPAVAQDLARYQALLTKIDEQTDFRNHDLSATVTVISHKPGEDDNVIQCEYFRRDISDKFVILIKKPEAQKGQGYLKIGDDITFYDPDSGQFSTVTGSSNFQNSDAKNSDFQDSTLAKDYRVVKAEPFKLVDKDTWKLTLEATRNTVTYPKRIIWVEQATNLVLKSEDFSLSGRVLRTSLYGRYIQIQDRFIPQIMRFEDNLKKGQVTMLFIQNPSLAKLPDTVFTKAFLERVSQ